jgi:hypothetical protein
MNTAIRITMATLSCSALFGAIMGAAHLAGTVNPLTVAVASGFSCYCWSLMVSE